MQVLSLLFTTQLLTSHSSQQSLGTQQRHNCRALSIVISRDGEVLFSFKISIEKSLFYCLILYLSLCRVEFLCHDISVHVPHHVNAKIPWYNLRKANESLRQASVLISFQVIIIVSFQKPRFHTFIMELSVQNWGDYMTECSFNWRMMKNIFTELHVYDEVRRFFHCLIKFCCSL